MTVLEYVICIAEVSARPFRLEPQPKGTEGLSRYAETS